MSAAQQSRCRLDMQRPGLNIYASQVPDGECAHMPHGNRFLLGLLRLGRGSDEVMAEAYKRRLCLD